MKKLAAFALTLIVSSALYAQEIPGKVVLQKGDIIKVTTDMTSSNTQSMMGGDPMEMKTNTNSYTELEVKEVLTDGYKMSQTMKKMKMDFDGFGQKTTYDSESKEKQDNPFVKQLAEKINIPEDIKLGFDGKLIEEEANEDKKAGSKDGKRGGGRGGMRMMGMGTNSSAESAFLVVPKDAVTKGGWEESTEKDGLKTRRKYTMGAVMGTMATVTVQSQTKGDLDMNRGGMPMTTKVNTLTEEMIMVNMSTGKVQMHTVNMTNNSKTIMNDKESPSTGKTTITTTVE
ncbi:MAG: hypothetical protein K9I70_09180 [Chitinophagaceae bacterium]|jgi:hypothetical protein|nr:hypothetical protein [Chitinophagaceae bacterium]